MNDIKYANLEDLKVFIEKLGWIWCGKIVVGGKKKTAELIDFEEGANLIVYDNLMTDEKFLNVYFTDHVFQVYKNNPNKKCDFDDYSLEWQNFLLERKDKDYTIETYLKSVIKNKSDEKIYSKKLSLIQKQIENLKFEKTLAMSKTNTLILNAKRHLNEKEINELDKKANETTKNL